MVGTNPKTPFHRFSFIARTLKLVDFYTTPLYSKNNS